MQHCSYFGCPLVAFLHALHCFIDNPSEKLKSFLRFEFLGWAFKTKKKKKKNTFICALIKNWAHFLLKNPTMNKRLSPDLIFSNGNYVVCPKNAANTIIRGFQLDHTTPQPFAN